MIVYHLTPQRNAAPIRWEGLKVSRAVGVPRIWFFTPCKRDWARAHIAKHQHCAPDDLIEFSFSVPRSWLKRWRRGVWLCYRDVSPLLNRERRSVTDFLYAETMG